MGKWNLHNKPSWDAKGSIYWNAYLGIGQFKNRFKEISIIKQKK